MLFTADLFDGIRAGKITCAFRRWRRPTVKAGGTLTTALGVLAIDSVEEIVEADITDDDARAAGAENAQAVRDGLRASAEGSKLYRIRFHRVGDDPRIELRETALTADERTEVLAALDRLDRASGAGAWTGRTLELIAAHPGVRAGDLAEQVGEERDVFKRRVRRLKALGLTESLEVGYRTTTRYRSLIATNLEG